MKLFKKFEKWHLGFSRLEMRERGEKSRVWSRVVVLELACAVHETSGGALCTFTAYVFSKVGESDELLTAYTII